MKQSLVVACLGAKLVGVVCVAAMGLSTLVFGAVEAGCHEVSKVPVLELDCQACELVVESWESDGVVGEKIVETVLQKKISAEFFVFKPDVYFPSFREAFRARPPNTLALKQHHFSTDTIVLRI